MSPTLKMLVSIDPDGALDMPAGPSEVLVIADKYAKARFVMGPSFPGRTRKRLTSGACMHG